MDLPGKNSVAYLLELARDQDLHKSGRDQLRMETKRRSKSLAPINRCSEPALVKIQNLGKDCLETKSGGGEDIEDVIRKRIVNSEKKANIQVNEFKMKKGEVKMMELSKEVAAPENNLEDEASNLLVIKENLDAQNKYLLNKTEILQNEKWALNKEAKAKETEMRALKNSLNWKTAQVEVLKKKESYAASELLLRDKKIAHLENENRELQTNLERKDKILKDSGNSMVKQNDSVVEIRSKEIKQDGTKRMAQPDFLLHEHRKEGEELQSFSMPLKARKHDFSNFSSGAGKSSSSPRPPDPLSCSQPPRLRLVDIRTLLSPAAKLQQREAPN